MRFGLVHRIMTDLLATLGLLSLITSGELHRWMSIGIVVSLVGAFLIPERYQDHPAVRNAGMVASVLLLGGQLLRLFLGGDMLALAVEFAAALQVIRLATRRGAAHDQQIILLALLHLVAGTVLGGGLAYGLCFLGFLVVAPGALVLSHLRREVEGNYRQGARDRTGLPVDVPRILRSRRVISKRFLLFTCSLSIPVFLFTAVLFVLFPRVGLSLLLLNHTRSTRMIGFSDHVDLGNVGKLRSDPTIAMRVHLNNLSDPPPVRMALYLRGTAFDRYDGKSWSRTVKGRTAAEQIGSHVWIRGRGRPLGEPNMSIDLEPISPPVVFLPPDALAFKLRSRGEPLHGRPITVFAGPEGEFKYTSLDERGLSYDVYRRSGVPPQPLTPNQRARYLRLPPELPDRIGELARRWAGSATAPSDIATRVEHQLRTKYQYDLASPSGAHKNPLDHFLFESRRGHCEFYSTAMAVMLRTLGVPTRNVTGFVGGTYNRFGGFYAVRQGDAHSWVEVYLPETGWTRFDPTPPAESAPRSEINGMVAFLRDVLEAAAQRWNRHVIGYDLHQQVQLLRNVSEKYRRIGGDRINLGKNLSKRRLALIVAALLLAGVGIYYFRRGRREQPPKKAAKTAQERAALVAVEMYQALERMMGNCGVPRRVSTPPLAHARGLAALRHPLGEEILSLTEIYLEARFGNRVLSEADQKLYLERVKALRALATDRQRAA